LQCSVVKGNGVIIVRSFRRSVKIDR